ncbi:MAG: hypothetical protein KDD36_03985 [Flavobacteriales bacterium]|nr:hypothetical protein [Flavobacteriales bacterium]
MKNLLLFSVIVAMITGCADSDSGSDCSKEVELLKKELELTKRELALREKSDGSASGSETPAEKRKKNIPSADEVTPSKKKVSAEETSASSGQKDPAWVVSQIFKAAKSGSFGVLSGLCDPHGHGDAETKALCNIRTAPANVRQDFVTQFKYGQVVGKPVIRGNEASVTMMTGPKGRTPKTMKLVNRDGKWYLSSY